VPFSGVIKASRLNFLQHFLQVSEAFGSLRLDFATFVAIIAAPTKILFGSAF